MRHDHSFRKAGRAVDHGGDARRAVGRSARGALRAARQAHVQPAESDFDPLPFDADAARVFGHVAASLRRSSRTTAARAYDAMIAATVIANGLGVHTSTPDDFAGNDGLAVVAVPHPAPGSEVPPDGTSDASG